MPGGSAGVHHDRKIGVVLDGGPAVGAAKGDKGAAAKRLADQFGAFFLEKSEHLLFAVADRDQEFPFLSQLFRQDRGNVRGTGRDHNDVKGSLTPQSLATVRHTHTYLVHTPTVALR